MSIKTGSCPSKIVLWTETMLTKLVTFATFFIRVFPQYTTLANLACLYLLNFENKIDSVASPINLNTKHPINFKIAKNFTELSTSFKLFQ